MKLRKAERLTGCEIRRIGGASAKVSYGAYDSGGQLVAEATHLIDDLALRAVPWSHAFADSSSALPLPRRNASGGESWAGLRRVPQGHSPAGALKVRALR
jgi:hypothetical protein